MIYVSQILYTFTQVVTKLAILLLYKSLFPGQGFLIAAYIIGAIILTWGLVSMGFAVFLCKPIYIFWSVGSSGCLDVGKFYVGNALPNIAIDIAVLCLPMKQVWGLRITRRQKVAVSAIFLLGGL